jgi:hypothetical protein
MKPTDEESIADLVKERLLSQELYPSSVFFTYERNGGCLAITFMAREDIDTFLDSLDYKSMCDKSGFTVYPTTRTVLLEGMALAKIVL